MKNYIAFISYKREDEVWAKWFQNELENYQLPDSLKDRSDLPQSFRPVFRDVDELKAGNLPEQILEALERSQYLVVICSPLSAKSRWVNKEINDFIEIGKRSGENRLRRVLPFIIEGIPHSHDDKTECFPKALEQLSDLEEIVGGNINEGGNVSDESRERAFLKTIAGMLPTDISFSMLWDKYEKIKINRERKEREEKKKLQRIQSSFLAEKVNGLLSKGDLISAKLLALKSLPNNIYNPDRPLVKEAELALRKAFVETNAIIHQGAVSCTCMSPDREIIAYAVRKKRTNARTSIILINNKGGIISELRGIHNPVNSIAFSSDGHYLLSASYVSTIRIWSVDSGEVIKSYRVSSMAIRSAMFINHDKCVLFTSTDRSVSVFDLEKERVIKNMRLNHNATVDCVTISPTGDYLASSSYDKTVQISDMTNNTYYTLIGHEDHVTFLMFSYDGSRLVSASEDKTIRIWGGNNWAEIRVLSGHQAAVNSARFSKDGKYIVSASDDKSVRVWDSETGKEIRKYDGHDSSVTWADFTKDSESIVSSSPDNTIRFWGFKGKKPFCPIQYKTKRIKSAVACPNGEHLLLTYKDGEYEVLSFGDEGVTQSQKGYLKYALIFTISHDGQTIAGISSDGDIIAINVEKGRVIRIFKDISYWKYKHLSQQCIDELEGKNDISDAFEDNDLHKKTFVNTIPMAMAFSPDGSCLASSTQDKCIVIWSVNNGVKIKKLKGHPSIITSLAFSPDGKWIAAASKHIFIWDIEKESIIMKFELPDTVFNTISFSHNGNYIIATSNNNNLRIVSTDNSQDTFSLKGSAHPFTTGCFSPDDKRIISTALNMPIRIWDAETGQDLIDITEYSNNPLLAFYYSDNKKIISVTKETLYFWEDVPTLQEMIDRTRNSLSGRALTPEQRKQYYLD